MAGPYNTSGQEKIILGFEKINEMYLSYQCILFSTYKKKQSWTRRHPFDLKPFAQRLKINFNTIM